MSLDVASRARTALVGVELGTTMRVRYHSATGRTELGIGVGSRGSVLGFLVILVSGYVVSAEATANCIAGGG